MGVARFTRTDDDGEEACRTRWWWAWWLASVAWCVRYSSSFFLACVSA